MNTSIVLSLDKRRSKKNGHFPLVFRLSHQGKTANIPTKISVPQSDWNNRTRKIKKTYKGTHSVIRLNNELEKKKADFLDIINDLNDENRLDYLTANELKTLLVKPRQKSSFFQFTEDLIDQLNEAKRYGNARAYKSALGALKNFHEKDTLDFEQISYSFLKKFETAHLKKGNSLNGLSTYMRTIRSVYNKAINTGIIPQEYYPFKHYKIKSEPTAKRAIDREKIKWILDLELATENPLFHARNYFLCSYLMNGITFIDMAFLKMGNIIDGRIQYKRQKTAKPYDIKITEQLASILDFYTKNKKKEDFVFPIIRRKDELDQYSDMRWERKRYNENLKKIAKLCGIEEHLTSYVSRHSMATNLILNDVPINALSKMLGHSKLSTTEIYIKGLPTHIMDEYQERLEIN
ncbi:MAG: site-specific integrase [Bacteroidota bacterium]